VLAYAPLFPHPKEEKWNFIVADANNNIVYNRQEVSLIEAEAASIAHPVSRPVVKFFQIQGHCLDVMHSSISARSFSGLETEEW